MSRTNFSDVHEKVRKACRKYGWDPIQLFNDKRKDGSRRISYSMGGIVDAREKTRSAILRDVKKALREYNYEVYWHQSHVFLRGHYWKLCVVVPAPGFGGVIQRFAPQIAQAMLDEARADEAFDHTDLDEYYELFDNLTEAVQKELEKSL